MKKLTDKEKARLQAKIEEEQTERTHRPKKEAQSPWMKTILLLVIEAFILFAALVRFTTSLYHTPELFMILLLALLTTPLGLYYIWRYRDRDE